MASSPATEDKLLCVRQQPDSNHIFGVVKSVYPTLGREEWEKRTGRVSMTEMTTQVDRLPALCSRLIWLTRAAIIFAHIFKG